MNLRLWALGILLTSVALTASADDLWSVRADEARARAEASSKPVLILWQAGPDAPAFVEETQRLFELWPAWAHRVPLVAVGLRLATWEGSWPAGLPPLPDPTRAALALWCPAEAGFRALWTEVPPVSVLTEALEAASGRVLPPAYASDLVAWVAAEGRLDRRGRGPYWDAWIGKQASIWVEEGPRGPQFLLKNPATGERLALPLTGTWAFRQAPGGPWEAWAEGAGQRPVQSPPVRR